jgi:hypothetical protein
VSLNLRRTQKYGNLHIHKIASPFLSSGNAGTYEKKGGSPPGITPSVLLLGEIPQNTHRNKKRAIYEGK